jgi:hypothetical protein
MTLDEIKAAVLAGKTVNWKQSNYVVRHSDKTKQFLIVCTNNDNCTGLTWRDGVTMNGEPDNFYISETNSNPTK